MRRATKILAEYIWIGGNKELRSKCKTISSTNLRSKKNKRTFLKPQAYPKWNFDGSSTEQATGEDSEVVLKPRAVYPNPLRNNSYLVMCDTYKNNGKPLLSNTRQLANNIFRNCIKEKPLFGIEQEYFLMDMETNRPLGFPKDGTNPPQQGQYYCSVGSKNSFGREIAEEHYQACLDAQLSISGINAEVAPGQWEYQIGPCVGIDAGDQLWTSRYLLERISEKYGVYINWEPKPIKGDWNGSGCHVNFDTLSMRSDNGYDIIMEFIKKLGKKHDDHMLIYGENNSERMTGNHETASFDEFSYGIGSRNTSIRIPNTTYKNKKGYIEDRRPASNCDPYLVTGALFETVIY